MTSQLMASSLLSREAGANVKSLELCAVCGSSMLQLTDDMALPVDIIHLLRREQRTILRQRLNKRTAW